MSNTLWFRPTSILSRNTFTFIPNSQSNTLSDDLRDRKALYLDSENSTGKKESDTLSLDEITKTTGRSTGTVAGRLSELCNEQLVERVGKGSYRLTTMGTRVVIKNLMPRVAQLPER